MKLGLSTTEPRPAHLLNRPKYNVQVQPEYKILQSKAAQIHEHPYLNGFQEITLRVWMRLEDHANQVFEPHASTPSDLLFYIFCPKLF